MRAIFGLGGVLIVLGVIVYVMKYELTYDKTAIDAGNKATEQMNQVVGRDATGDPVKLSATLEPQSSTGATTGVLVTSVKADGPYATFWKLQRNDLIVEIGPLPVKQVVTDTGAADDYVMDAYQHHESLTVVRDGQKMTLNGNESAATAGKPKSDSIQDQLNSVIPTH